jgi:hypothetical protein
MVPLRSAAAIGLLILLLSPAYPEEAAPGTSFIPVPYAFYTPETNLAGGIILMVVSASDDADHHENVFRGGGYVTLNAQAEAFLGMEYSTPGNGLRLVMESYIARFPNKFFGIGPAAGGEEGYVPLECVLDSTLGFLLAPGLYLGPRLRMFGSWMQQRALDGLLIQDVIAGSDGAGLVGPGFRLTWDSRDSTVEPTRGFLIDFSGTWSLVTFGGSSYPAVSMDARLFHSPFTGSKVVLAAQLCAAFAGGAPPFQELPRLGGDELMRGYYDGRYRDNALVAAQAEIRIPVWWRFGLALFCSAGQVAQDPLSFRFENTKVSGGAGLRFVLDEKSRASLRADVAVGEDGADFYFNLGEAF